MTHEDHEEDGQDQRAVDGAGIPREGARRGEVDYRHVKTLQDAHVPPRTTRQRLVEETGAHQQEIAEDRPLIPFLPSERAPKGAFFMVFSN